MITNAVVGNFLSNTKHNKLRSPQNLPDMCIQSDFILNDIWISNKNSKKKSHECTVSYKSQLQFTHKISLNFYECLANYLHFKL